MKEATVGPEHREMARQMRADGVSEGMGEDEFRLGKGVTKIEALRGAEEDPREYPQTADRQRALT